jgi:hypothetical protein
MNETPPLGGTTCPDPRWNAGGAELWIQGLENMVGPRWIIMVDGVGLVTVPGPAPPEPPVPPITIPEGSIPFVDWIA